MGASTCRDVPNGKCDFSYVEMTFGATSLNVPCYFDTDLRECVSMTSCAESKEPMPTRSPAEAPPTGSPTETGQQCFDEECEDLYSSSCRAAAGMLFKKTSNGGEIVGFVDGGSITKSTDNADNAESCRAFCV